MQKHSGIWLRAILIGAVTWAAAQTQSQAQEAPSDPHTPVVTMPAGTPPPAAPADNNVPTATLPPGETAPAAPPPTPGDAGGIGADTGSSNVHVSDGELKKQVERALHAHYGLGKSGIRVSVTQGVVTLRGTVASSVQIDQAKDVVSRVPGVQEINNELHSRGNGSS